MAKGSQGQVMQVTGPVVDVEFPPEQLPEIFNALEVQNDGHSIVLEVEQQLGDNWVRTVAMDTTEGLRRGLTAVDTGAPIRVPVGPPTLGRMFNVVGQPIDQKGAVEAKTEYPIHREAPP